MAPHWKCGSGQPVEGSNPSLSAISARRDRGRCPRWRTALLAHASSDALAPVLGAALASTTLAARYGLRASRSRPMHVVAGRGPSEVSFAGRARRGTSGALYLQSAPAGLNPLPRSPLSNAARRCDVEDRVPRSGEPRTVSGPEGSSTKRSSSGAAERPGPSRSSWWAREFPGRRRVHGNLNSLAHVRRRS
jgi:hypothetical protein